MTLNASRISLKIPVVTAALLLASASVFAQQAATPQSSDDAAKKHPAGVKYQSMTVKSANPNSPTAQPVPMPPQATQRKNGAIHAADFDKRQAGEPTEGAATTAGKGIGSAGIPGKTSVADKTSGAPLKGCPKCASANESQKQPAKSATAK